MSLYRSRRWLILAVAALSCTGCLINTNSVDVIDPHAQRRVVNFESDAALKVFQDEVTARYKKGAVLHEGGLAVPFVIAAHEKKVLSENAFYNEQVAKCDANGDALITEAEARVYAGKPVGAKLIGA